MSRISQKRRKFRHDFVVEQFHWNFHRGRFDFTIDGSGTLSQGLKLCIVVAHNLWAQRCCFMGVTNVPKGDSIINLIQATVCYECIIYLIFIKVDSTKAKNGTSIHWFYIKWTRSGWSWTKQPHKYTYQFLLKSFCLVKYEAKWLLENRLFKSFDYGVIIYWSFWTRSKLCFHIKMTAHFTAKRFLDNSLNEFEILK